MFNVPQKHSAQAIVAAFTLASSSLAPLTLASPSLAQTTFSDVQGNWAQSCISQLSQQGIISGYPDGTFRPSNSVTRAEFAAMVGKAFPNAARTRNPIAFSDVPNGYWAYNAVATATQTGFMSGYPGNIFNPTQNIPRAQVLVALSSGLNYSPAQPVSNTLGLYSDSGSIPGYAQNGIAAATEKRLVVNYPDVRYLNPNQLASRAEVAAFFCQALAGSGQVSSIPSQYVAGVTNASTPTVPNSSSVVVPAGTILPMRYAAAQKIVVSPSETAALTLTVAQDIRNSQGIIVIPAGSQVIGQLQPATGGSQFVARQLVVNGQTYNISASSNIVTTTRSARDPNIGTILGGAALGSGAAAAISAVTGNRNITTGKVLLGTAIGTAVGANLGRDVGSIVRDTALGAAAGAVISGVSGNQNITAGKVLAGAATGAAIGGIADPGSTNVIVINPNSDLTLTLANDLVL